MKLTTPALMMCRVIAHHLLHKTELAYQAEDGLPEFVKPTVLYEMFPVDHVRGRLIGQLEGMRDDDEGNFEHTVIREKGLLWTVTRDILRDFERTGRVETTGLRLTNEGIQDLVYEGYVPDVFSNDLRANADTHGSEKEFKDWLTNEWKDPTTEGYVWYGKATEETGRKATIKGSSFNVTKLRYTEPEAIEAKAFIDADTNLSNRTKGAYKAHVGRRTY